MLRTGLHFAGRFLFFLPFLIEGNAVPDAEGLRILENGDHILICSAQQEPDTGICGLDAVMAMKILICVFRAWCIIPWSGFCGRTGGGNRKGFGISGQIQPDLPACPGPDIFCKRNVMRGGRQKHRAVHVFCI